MADHEESPSNKFFLVTWYDLRHFRTGLKSLGLSESPESQGTGELLYDIYSAPWPPKSVDIFAGHSCPLGQRLDQ